MGFNDWIKKVFRRKQPSSPGSTTKSSDGYVKKFFRGIGRILERTAFVAVLATGIGAIQYLRGAWPFTEVKEREYQITQWFNEARAKPLEGPGTRWLVRPLIRKVEKNKVVQSVPADVRQHDCGEFKFRTKDNLEGMIRAQYLYYAPNRENAKQFYWEYGGDPTRIDVVIKGALARQIGRNVKGKEIASGLYIDEKDKKTKNYLLEAENEANKILGKDGEDGENVGIKVTNFAITSYDFNPESEAVLKQEIRAEEEAKATIIQANATLEASQRYIAAAQLYRDAGSDRKVGDIAMYLADLDNNQEIAGRGNIIFKSRTDVPYAPPIIPFPTQPTQNTPKKT